MEDSYGSPPFNFMPQRSKTNDFATPIKQNFEKWEIGRHDGQLPATYSTKGRLLFWLPYLYRHSGVRGWSTSKAEKYNHEDPIPMHKSTSPPFSLSSYFSPPSLYKLARGGSTFIFFIPFLLFFFFSFFCFVFVFSVLVFVLTYILMSTDIFISFKKMLNTLKWCWDPVMKR